MAPGNNKRKRPERQVSREEASGRPSPHRPENLGLAQQNQQYGGSSRGGRGGGGVGRRQSRQFNQSPVNGVNAAPSPSRNAASSTQVPAPAAALQRDSPAVDGSRPATPSQSQMAAPTSQPPAEEVEKSAPAPYWYEYITDSVAASWEESGRDGILQLAKDADEMTTSLALQELVRSSLDGRLNAAGAGSLIKDIIAQHPQDADWDVQSLFLNTISLLEDSDTKSPDLLALVAATDIDPEVIRLELDIPLLQALTLVRNTFTQMRTRKTTNILYRQANFNLLREESEGYAKLITEYFNTANEATHDHNVSAEKAFERITALVGSFDLDVGRVLDITLDISANLLVRAYVFFVKFYRCSSWWPDNGVMDNVSWEDQGFGSFPKWALPSSVTNGFSEEDPEALPRIETTDLALLKEERDLRFWLRVQETGMDAYFELGMRKIVDFEAVLPLLQTEVPPEHDARGKEINADRRKRINENRKYMAETGMLPPPGNSDAAQLLGFKLRFYSSSARNKDDILPENLIYLAGLLIKIGFISLRDLYPHLYPPDDKMAEEKARLEKAKAEKEAKDKPGVGTNALAMAGALPDDTLAPPRVATLREKEKSGGSTPKPEKKDEEPIDELPAPTNQKILLLKALLVIGALPEALYILGRFPWIVDVDTTIPPYLHRIANHMLSEVAELVRPISRHDDARNASEELNHELANPQPDGTILLKPRVEKKTTRWLGLDEVQNKDGETYRHYYTEWDDNIPLCQNIEDVILLCNTFLGYLGVKIGQDAKLLSTLIRIAKYSLSKDFSDANQSRWLDLMRRLLVPALSLSKHNAGLTQEVFELLKFFPTTTRYNIYAEWFRGKTSRLPDMRVAFDHNKAEVKDVLRRVTNENGKKQARALAKITFSSPGIVMLNMISQLESYSNMIPSLVECTRYFSLLAYDVLIWCLINSLSGQGRDRMQADGMLTSPWLQALSQFVASLFYKYTALNPSPVLQYLASELRDGNSTDLEMFEQVLAEMAGIKSDMEYNDAQVLAMAGGKHLQAQTVLQLADRRHERKTPARLLVKALAEPGLIGQMLISIAQERQMYGHHESSSNMPLKVLGNNLDKIQSVFAQYLDVLKTNLDPSEFEDVVPDVVSLVGDFGLRPGIAFTVCRFVIAHRITEFDSMKRQAADEKRRLSQEQPQANGDVEMQDGKVVVNGDHSTPETLQAGTPEALIGEDSKNASTPQASSISHDELQHWHPVLQPIIQRLPQVSSQLAERVSIPFYVSFWTRTLQDILVHTISYDNEINKLRTQLKEVNADRSDSTAIVLKERERKKKELSAIQDKLREELKARIASYQKTRNRISRQEKDHWFDRSMDRSKSDARHLGLLQECFIPRAMLSSLDAHYCFLMLKILHENGTPGFCTMRLLNQLFQKQALAAIIFQCTAMEAQHFGRFLSETLKLLSHWHADKVTYDREALGEKQKLPGFAQKLDANGEPLVVLDFEQYRRLLFNWHSYLNASLNMCFESGEYMHIRNGIIVLKSVVQVFPSLNFMGHAMVKQVTKLSEEDSRQDLKLAAMSLLGPLRNREKQWLMPQAFRLNDPSKEAIKSASRAPSAQPEASQSGAGTPKLNATAPEFKPSSSLTNGVDRKESIAGTEDGEIEDEKQAAAKDGDRDMPDAKDTDTTVEAPGAKNEVKADDKDASEPVSRAIPADSTKQAQPASKPSTPAPIPSRPPPVANEQRQDFSRPPSSRAPHAVPSRLPNKPMPTPPGPERAAGRHGRPNDSYGRLERPSDMRPSSRDHSPSRSRARTPERDAYPYHGSHGSNRPPPPRDERGPPRPVADTRHARDDSWSHNRRDQQPHPGMHSRPSYDSRERTNGAMGPPASTNSERSGYASINTPGSAPQQSSRPISSVVAPAQNTSTENVHHENPARLAMINDDPARARGGDTPKHGRGDRESKDERGAPSARSNDSRMHPQEPSRDAPPRTEQPSDLAPTGPRRSNGRLSRDLGSGMAPAAESSYGRLNGPQDAPSGPRPQNAPGGRSVRGLSGNDPALASSSNARPPESPAGMRPPSSRQTTDARSSTAQFDQQPSSNSLPTTPATENGPAVHPSRLGQLDVPPPPPIQTNLPAIGPRNANSPTTAPPSGPRASGRPPPGTPTGPSPNGPPSGPASTAERQRRTDRQRANINATLQGAGTPTAPTAPSVNFRGAAQGRQSSISQSSTSNAQPNQAIASAIEPPATRNEPAPERHDAPPNRPDTRPDLFQGNQGPGNEEDRRGDRRGRPRGEERPEGPERQRSGFHIGGERRPAEEQYRRQPFPESGPPRDDRRPRGERETRERGPPRDSRAPQNDEIPLQRRPLTQEGQSFHGQPPQWDRGNERRGPPQGEGPEDNRRGGRGGGRPEEFRGPRREEERREGGRALREGEGQGPPPPPPPGTRKRRHDELPFDETKRRRSGR